MRKFIGRILLLVGWIVSAFLLSLQLAYFLSFGYNLTEYRNNYRFILDPKVIWWQGNDQYFKLTVVVIGLGSFLLLLRMFMPDKHDRQHKAAKRRMTKDEKIQYSHLATRHEIKKGLTRIQYNMSGNLVRGQYSFAGVVLGRVLSGVLVALLVYAVIQYIGSAVSYFMNHAEVSFECVKGFISIRYFLRGVIVFVILAKGHLRDYCDYLYDPAKKLWNELMYLLRMPDVKKMNTIKTWEIGEEKKEVRSGLPIITHRRVMWLDASDSHNLVIGTTNSGKTWSLIHEMIEVTRMAGESMVVNDLKGELHRAHRKRLLDEGYRVICLNFVFPDKGDCWNPFELVVQKYRKAQDEAWNQIKDDSFKQQYLQMKKEYLMYNGKIQSMIRKAETSQTTMIQNTYVREIKSLIPEQQIKKEILRKMEEGMPQPNFSEAFEYLRDIGLAIFPSGDKGSGGSDNSFWNKNGMRLMEGIVCFMLEHEYIGDNGEICRLEDDQINFKNFQMVVNDAFSMVRTDITQEPEPLIKFYLSELRRPTDHSVITLKSILAAPEETRGSITEVFATYMDLGILNDNICRMTSRSSFDIEDIWNEKLAIFLIAHDEKDTYYPLSVMFINQLLAEISRKAREETSQRLKYPVNILWDEFGISPPIKNLNNALSAARSKGVRFTLVIQDFSQLSIQYNKNFSEMIKNNTMNVVYLLGGNPETQKEMSERIGNRLQWNKEKGNYDVVPILTRERLSRMSVGEAVVVSQRKNPCLVRYLPYDRYIFYKSMGEPMEAPVRVLDPHCVFSLEADYQRLSVQGSALRLKEDAPEPDPYSDVPYPDEVEGESKPKKKKTSKKKKEEKKPKFEFDDSKFGV